MEKMIRNNSSSPVFVLSCERSGSTMLRYILDTHSKIACPAHLYLGEVCGSLIRLFSGTIAQTQAGLNEAERNKFAMTESRKVIEHIMERYLTAKTEKAIWCDKTPMNIESLELLNTVFHDAKYICLYRHCMDVVHSSLNLSKYRFLPEHVLYVHRNPGNIIAAMAENWMEKTDKLLKFEAAHREQCFRITYESIVTAPEEALTPLFKFLGVEWEKDLIDRVFMVDHDKGEGDGRAALSSKIRQDSVGKGIEVPRTGIPKKFITDINRLLGKLGYPGLDTYYSNGIRNEINEEHMPDISDIFENRFMNALKNNRYRYPDLKGIWKLIVKGNTDRFWVIDLSHQEATLKKGDHDSDTTVCFSAALLVDMINGTRDAIEAFSHGEIEIEGADDKEALMNLGRLLFS